MPNRTESPLNVANESLDQPGESSLVAQIMVVAVLAAAWCIADSAVDYASQLLATSSSAVDSFLPCLRTSEWIFGH